MLIVVLGLVTLLSVPLVGGRLQALATIRPRRTWVILAALGLQIVAISVVPGWPRPLLVAAHLFSYLLAGWWVWENRSIAGLPIITLGGFLNGFTIAINGGTLPASPTALARAGIHPVAGKFNNSGILVHPHLAFLGDVFAIPAGWPLANVFSVGDFLILLGLAVGLHVTCGSRLVPPRWRRSLPTEPAAAQADGRRDRAGRHRAPAGRQVLGAEAS
jgi:hypothetical protein